MSSFSFEDTFAANPETEFDVFAQFTNDDQYVQAPNASEHTNASESNTLPYADIFSQLQSNDASGSSVNPAPVASSSQMSRAPSSESESSLLANLDNAPATTIDPTYGLDLNMLTGAPPAYNNTGVEDPLVSSFFGNDNIGNGHGNMFGNNNFGNNNTFGLQQQHYNYNSGFNPSFPSSTSFNPSLPQSTVSPASLSFASLQSTPDFFTSDLPSTGQPMKRKASADSEGSEPKKKRGRPCKTLSADSGIVTPLLPKQKRQPAKPSVAKPKAVVPAKYIKDGTAEAALGMTAEQIQSFPDFESLLLAISPENKDRAVLFGEQIERGRKLAADAAQQMRHAKEEKMSGLEEENRLLKGVNEKMKERFLALFNQGRISQDEFLEFTQ